MNLVKRKEMEGILKRFNDEEMGGEYIYFLHEKELVKMDLCDYSTVTVCGLDDIEEIVLDDEGLYLNLYYGIYDGVDSVWIDEIGCQM